jgi:lipoprotein-anchoring transpeptidase ErfK/SrfK
MNVRLLAASGAAGIYIFSLPAWAQDRSQGFPFFKATTEDVAPGVDHGNSNSSLPEQFQRQAVYYRSQHPAGTVVVETSERHLYLIEGPTRAMRYGIGVGRDGFTWQGLLQISRKAEWPDWHPPPEMIERQPYLPRFMAGGPGNPLGARAMHLGNTVYRIHGTNAPETIGHAVSSGCFRLVNDDVVDLYTRVAVGTHVIVRQN